LSNCRQASKFVVKTFNNLSHDSPASIKEYANSAFSYILMVEEKYKDTLAENELLRQKLKAVKKDKKSVTTSSDRQK
jgi:hypothetical protein